MLKYDIAVIGGGTAGCAAAFTAAKLGLKTILIEKNIHLGGSISSGLVVPAMHTGENQINTKFFNALTTELHSIGGQITYQNNQGWFNPELIKIALDSLVVKTGVDVYFNTSVHSVRLNNRVIDGLVINSNILLVSNYKIQNNNNLLSVPIETRYVIDATGNCEIGKLCNCEFLNKKDEQQPVSLRFIMSGVNVKRLADWLLEFDADRNVTTVENIDGYTHLSTAYTWDGNWALAPLFEDAVAKGVLKDTDRNYFQIFTIAGMPTSVAFNCPRIVEDTDIYDIKSVSNALIEARKVILRISNFCKIYLPGFEKSYISNIADMLGIRVSERIKGKYIYTVDDLKSGKKFEHPVLISNYPVDVHSKDKGKSALLKVQEYQLPVESLMSADIDNLFVVGRCISADFMAQGALRVQPNCFAMGEGAAKYIKAKFY